MSCYLLPAFTSFIDYSYYPTLYACNSTCCASGVCPQSEYPVMPATNELSPSFVPTAVVLNTPADLLGSSSVYGTTTQNSLFYQSVTDQSGVSSSSSSSSTLRPVEMLSLCHRRSLTFSEFRSSSSTSSSADRRLLAAGAAHRRRRAFRRGGKSSHDPGTAAAAAGREAPAKDGEELLRNESNHQYPLYCSLCRIKLNAQIQAKQHYTGKQHRRRLKTLTRDTSNGREKTESAELNHRRSSSPKEEPSKDKNSDRHETVDDLRSSRSPQHQGYSKPSVERSTGPGRGLSCDIYCAVCAVSFNSTTQARQHYHGKTHARRLRSAHDLSRPSTSRSCPNEFATKHKNALYTCLVCNSRPSEPQSQKKKRA